MILYNSMIEKKIKSIEGLIGDVIHVSMSNHNASYARVKVVIKLDNPLLPRWWFHRVKLEPVWIDLNCLSFVSSYHGRIGHDKK